MFQKLPALVVIATFFVNTLFAQFNYDLTVSQATYQPLTTAISANDTVMWDEEYYKVPIGFTFQMDTFSLSDISIIQSFVTTDTQNTINGFVICDADLYDRGNAGAGVSISPIRYRVDGVPGSRVFKLELANAGFYDEWDLYGTNNDSLYAQVWLYEGTNIVELRYGPHNITNPTDYFTIDGGDPVVGFLKGLDMDMGAVEVAYFLYGSAANPSIDSTTDLLSMGGLNSFPADGTVYRFTPKSTGVHDLENAVAAIELIGNVSPNQLVVNNRQKEKVQFEIFSVTGAQVGITGDFIEGKNIIDISALATGTYILQAKNNKGIKALRFTRI